MNANPLKWFSHLRTRYILHRHPIPHDVWHSLMSHALFKGLSAVEKAHLRELSTLFLYHKNFIATQEFRLSQEMLISIAAQACLPILNLGLNCYDGWRDIIIYPVAFKVNRNITDSIGLVSHEEQFLGGEAWSKGPVILSWEMIYSNLRTPHSGHNVVIHEFAHKLDMLNGTTNGMPPLHPKMVREDWTQAFSDAFEHLQQQIERGHRPDINAYAATSPAEFFAVCSEYFFTAPENLNHHFPKVYEQLTEYFRQDPKTRKV